MERSPLRSKITSRGKLLLSLLLVAAGGALLWLVLLRQGPSPEGAPGASGPPVRRAAGDTGAISEPYVFHVRGDGNDLDVFLAVPEEDAVYALAPSPHGEYSPALSPDRSRVVFARNENEDANLFVVGTDGSGLRRLTEGDDTDGGPVWSPDGRWVAFWRSGDGQPEIYVISTVDGIERRITYNDVVDVFPAWSPDGSSIAFARDDRGVSDIFVADVATGTETRLTRGGDFGHPRWSPDGSTLLAIRSSDSPPESSDLVEISIDGTVRLVRADVGGIVASLGWRPEGIVYTSTGTEHDRFRTFVVDPRTLETVGTVDLEGEPTW